MKYSYLPSTEIKVSKICLVTMTFGNQNSEDEAFEQMDYALDKGVNFFDTAELYPVPATPQLYADTEKIIGKWMKERKNRDQIVLATKIAGPGDYTKHIRTTGFSKNSIISAVDGSLKRLKTDYIDLYQLHWPERSTNFFGRRDYLFNNKEGNWNSFENILEALDKYLKSGKIRYIGMSNETPYGLSRYLEISKNKGAPRMMSVQNPYNLVNRTYEIGMSEISIREKCGLLVYYPLAAGGLSGKYKDGKKPKGSRMALFKGWDRHLNPLAMKAYDKYFKVAQDFNLTMVQLAQSFVNSRPFVTSNIIGATTMDQLKENVESINIEFTDEMMDRVNEIHNNNPNPSP